MEIKESKIQNFIYGYCLIFLASIFRILFLYTQNIDTVKLSEIFLPIIVCIIGGFLVYSIFSIFLKSSYKSALVSVTAVLLLTNYGLIEKGLERALPQMYFWHYYLIVLTIIIFLFVLLLYIKNNELEKNLVKILTIVFSTLILINIIMAIPSIIKGTNNKKTNTNVVNTDIANTEISNNSTNANSPNIYWMVFDEYAGFRSINETYGYDNAEFKNYLEKNNFQISTTSISEDINTLVVLNNTVNLEYVLTSDTPTSEQIATPPGKLYTVLKNAGYSVKGVGDTQYFGLESSTSSGDSTAVTIDGLTFQDIILSSSILRPFYEMKTEKVEQLKILDTISYLKNIENLPTSPTFTFLYISSPHTPFLFDENGGYINSAHRINWPESKYYLGQYKFITKEIMSMTDFILENDPDAIILIQSDHGVRMVPDGSTFAEYAYKDILNVLHLPGGYSADIIGKDGLNTMIEVLNSVIGTNIEQQVKDTISDDK